jgi:hypothetical protein
MCGNFFDSKRELKNHIDKNHRIKDQIAVSSTAAEIIADEILSSSDGILSTSVRDDKGRLLAVKFKDSFKKAFARVTQPVDNYYGGAIAIAALSVANEVKDLFGEPKAIVTIYKDCKLMLISLPSYEIIVGLVLERWVDADDDKLAKNIERLVADTLAK